MFSSNITKFHDYFFSITEPLSEAPRVYFTNKDGSPANVKISVYNRNNGSYIISYHVISVLEDIKIEVLWRGGHVAKSPYLLLGTSAFNDL